MNDSQLPPARVPSFDPHHPADKDTITRRRLVVNAILDAIGDYVGRLEDELGHAERGVLEGLFDEGHERVSLGSVSWAIENRLWNSIFHGLKPFPHPDAPSKDQGLECPLFREYRED